MERFKLGPLLITPGAADAMIGEDRMEYSEGRRASRIQAGQQSVARTFRGQRRRRAGRQ